MEHISKHLIPITDQVSKELLQHKSQQPVTTDQKIFIASLKTAQVIQRPVSELKEVLRLIMIKIGLRGENFPTEEGKEVLHAHILEHYGGHTHEEIKHAFDLAITGKLEFPEKQDANHYQNFSCEYFSRIMSSYRVWASKTYKEVVKPKHPEIKKEELNDVTMQNWWNDYSRQVRHEGMRYNFMSLQLYKWAEEKGLIKNSGLKKSDFLKLAVEKKIEELQAELKSGGTESTMRELENYLRMKNFSIVEALYVNVVKDNAKRLLMHQMMLNEKDPIHETHQDETVGEHRKS